MSKLFSILIPGPIVAEIEIFLIYSPLTVAGLILKICPIKASKLAEYATLPSREQLLTMLAGGMIGIVRDLSICLDLYSQQKEEN